MPERIVSRRGNWKFLIPKPVARPFNAREIMERLVRLFLDHWRARATFTNLKTLQDWSCLISPPEYQNLQVVDNNMILISIPYDSTGPLPNTTGHMAVILEYHASALEKEIKECTSDQLNQLKSVFQLELQKEYIDEWTLPLGHRRQSREVYLDTDNSPSRQFMAQMRPDWHNPLPPDLVRKLEFFLNTSFKEKVSARLLPVCKHSPDSRANHHQAQLIAK